MVKAKDFLEFLCNELDYRFFSGTSTSGSEALYKHMSPDFMHYMPAATEQIALGLVAGSLIAGFKSVVILPTDKITQLDWSLNLPVLVIAFGKSKLPSDFLKVKLSDSFKKSIKTLVTKVNNQVKPGVILVEGGQLI